MIEKEIIIQKLQYLESKILISRCSDVYKWIIGAMEGKTEINPCKIVGSGKNTRYLDRTEQLIAWLNFLKIPFEFQNNSLKKGKIHNKIIILID